MTDAAQVTVAADLVQAEWGAPDILVNNAGAFHLAPFEETSTADFDAQVAANLRGPWLVAKAFVPLMRAGRGGLVVTVGSVADHVGFPGNAAYAAAKYGVRGLHETLARRVPGLGRYDSRWSRRDRPTPRRGMPSIPTPARGSRPARGCCVPRMWPPPWSSPPPGRPTCSSTGSGSDPRDAVPTRLSSRCAP